MANLKPVPVARMIAEETLVLGALSSAYHDGKLDYIDYERAYNVSICRLIALQRVDHPRPSSKQIGRANGGYARAAALSPGRRSEIARKAANARWSAQGMPLAEPRREGGSGAEAPASPVTK